jgi:hypothetical protein
VPLSDLQRDILLLLAAHRSPESYVAGATALNRDGPRFSSDIDIFHDREESVAVAASADVVTLVGAGFAVEWLRREPGFHAVVVERHGKTMRLEWARDSDFRFFPTVRDAIFGFMLHVVDIATNKILAAAGRREPRDILDLLHIHGHVLPLGAVIWAATAKDPGFSPESLICEIRRNARYRADDYADLELVEPVDAGAVSRKLRSALDEAETFVRAMPAGKEGLLFLGDGRPVQPDSAHLASFVEHAGRRLGHWPTSPEISAAMLQRQAGNDADPES